MKAERAPSAGREIVAREPAEVALGPFMTLSEAAPFIRLSVDKVDRLVRAGVIPYIDLTDLAEHRSGARRKKLIRFSRESLIRWMMKREHRPASQQLRNQVVP